VSVEKIKLYLHLLYNRDWRGINYRMQYLLRRIDTKNAYLDELNLSAERSFYYSDSGGKALERVLDSLSITPRDAIVDFGCGKGGALISLAKYPFSQIAGVEISEKLVGIAQSNLRRLRIENVRLECCDAAAFTDLDGFNFFYFFSPFPSNVMQAVIKNIADSITRTPRKVTIIYLNPECHEAVVSGSPFIKVKEFDHPTLSFYIYSNVAQS